MEEDEKNRRTSRRSTEVHSRDEILRRVAFIIYLVGGIGGGVLLIAAAATRREDLAILGAIGLVLGTLLHVTRHRWGAARLAEEVRKNPFRKDREDGES